MIRTIHIQGFKSIAEQTFELGRLNCLIGEPHPLLSGLECELDLKTPLARLPKKNRIKTTREYVEHAGSVTREWARVTRTCTQAERFHSDVRAVLGSDIAP